jgi:hypothetical protein
MMADHCTIHVQKRWLESPGVDRREITHGEHAGIPFHHCEGFLVSLVYT